jgi:hypothetical protein
LRRRKFPVIPCFQGRRHLLIVCKNLRLLKLKEVILALRGHNRTAPRVFWGRSLSLLTSSL